MAQTQDAAIADGTQRCDACGAEKPASLVDRTSIATIETIEADVCRLCQLVHKYDRADGACLQCGDDVDVPRHLEIEFPVGDVDAAALLSSRLCGGCAQEIAVEVLFRALEADDERHARYVELIHEEDERLREIDRAEGP